MIGLLLVKTARISPNCIAYVTDQQVLLFVWFNGVKCSILIQRLVLLIILNATQSDVNEYQRVVIAWQKVALGTMLLFLHILTNSK